MVRSSIAAKLGMRFSRSGAVERARGRRIRSRSCSGCWVVVNSSWEVSRVRRCEGGQGNEMRASLRRSQAVVSSLQGCVSKAEQMANQRRPPSSPGNRAADAECGPTAPNVRHGTQIHHASCKSLDLRITPSILTTLTFFLLQPYESAKPKPRDQGLRRTGG